MAQNPISGNQGFQILSEGNFTFTGYTHVHGPLGVGGNLIINDNGTLAEICMDGVGSYVFPGDGTTTTGLLVKGGVTWTAGGAKVMGGKLMHIGSSTGCTQSDNGVNQATQVLPTGGVYNQAKRLEGALDQTPSPAVFQTIGFDFTTLFNTYRSVSTGLLACSNNVQLYNASNVAIASNNVASAQNVQINSLANGVNHLDLTQTSLNNITELKFNAGALPSATKLLVISVPLTSNFVWNNSNMPGLAGATNGAYILWNFTGATSYNLTINTASLIIGTVFSPNHNLIKTGTGDIDGNLIAKSMTLGLGEIHFYPFSSSVPLCSEVCNNGVDDDGDGLVDALDTDCNTCAFVGQNLVVNGEFDSGNTGFGSDYTFTPITNMCGNWGIYSVGKTIKQVGAPNGCNNGIWAASDRNGPTGNFMLIDPSAATGVNDRIWYQTIPVCQNTNYVFSVWTKNMYYSQAGGYSGVDPNFQFAINGTVLPNANFIMPRQVLADSAKWIKVQGTWNSGAATSAILSVVNMIPGAYGNDLAIDGLYFGLCGKTASISASGTNYCPGSPVTLTASASTSSSGWAFYEWLRNGVVVSSGTTATSYIANAAGSYKLRCYTTANNTGCPQESNALTIGSVCPENCSNGIDDDGDGLADCADADCVVNAITNSEFDSGTTGWNLYLQSGNTGTFTVDNTSQISTVNSAFINIGTATGTNWHIQFVQTGKSIVAGKTYRVSFRAKATANRQMNVMLQQVPSPYANYWNQNVALTTTVQSYAFNFPVTVTNSGQVGLYFNLGESTADVYIDNIIFNEICLAEVCNNGLDDDMDGFVDNLDSDCPAVSCAPTIFFTENFGTGARTSMPYTNYCYESGSGANCTFAPSTDINDGEYAIAQWPKPTSSNGDWTTSGDHTGNAQGRMMVVNADYAPGEFYRRTITGVVPNVNVTVDLWLRNTILPGYNLIKPNITFKLYNSSNVLLGSVATGDLPEDNTWHNYLLDLNPGNSTSVTVVLVNNAPGGVGNDLGLDDIVAKQTLTPTAPIASATCANPNSTITITSPLGANLQYSIDGTTYQASPSFTGVAPGTYSITARYASSLCASQATSLTISPAPTATVTGNTTLCSAGSTTLTASGGGTYAWSTGATTAAITVTPASTTTYTVTVSQPYATPFNNANFNFINSVNSYGAASSLFNGVDDINAASFHATRITDGLTWGIAYKLGGDYLITNLGLDRREDCCTDRGEGGVFQVYDNGVLAYQSNVLNAAGTNILSTSPAMSNIIGDEVRYVFLAGANTLAADNILNISEWIITAKSACPAIASKTVTVGTAPTAAVSGTNSICTGASTTLTASGGGTYAWSNGATTPAITVTPAITTTYTVTVTSASGCTATANSTVTVNALPAATISGATSSCTGAVASLTASGGTSYLWNTGATTALLSGVPAATATYTVTVTNASGCTATAAQTVTVNPLPTASAGVNATVCAGGSTTLTATGGGNYAWSTGASTAAVSVAPAITTTYTVTVTSAAGCTATAQSTVTVVAVPTITTQPASATICTGLTQVLSVVATGGTPSLTYQWQSSLTGTALWTNISGATSSSYTTPALSLTSYYRVIVSASGSGCSSVTSNVATVSIGVGLTPVITGTTAICPGNSTTLSTIGGGTYAWSNGASTASIVVSPASATTYTVTVTNLTGCSGTAQVTVTINALPTASAGANATICAGSNTTLTATGGTTYNWSNGIGTGAAKIVSPATTTTYTVTVTNAAGCTATSQVTVSVNPAPTADAGADATICGGLSTTLTATGGTTYAWSNSLGSGATKTVSPATTTTYTVTVTNAQGCTATDQVVVNVNAAPISSAGSNVAICNGTSTTLIGSASGGVSPYTYAWNNGLGSGASKTVNPITTTTYIVTVTGSNGCTSTAQATVTVNAVPTASAGTDITICPLTTTTLTATGAGAPSPYSFAWSNGVSGATQTVLPLLTTTYTVTVTSSNGCFATATKKVTIGACAEICNNLLDDDGDGLADCADSDCGPTANAGSDISICPSTPAFLSVGVTGGSAPYTYAWSNGLGSGASKTVTPAITTTYSVTVTSASGCTNVDQIKVTVNACSENCTNGIDDDGDGLVDCADPDCAGVTAPILADDNYTTCPGLAFSNRVTYNDGNLNNPAFTIAVQPQHGTVNIDWTGMFVYTPNTFECLTDYFTYQVCNQTSGCCQTAVVSITLGDNTLPVLTNVPADLTISCDDAIPSPSVVTAFDQCPGIYMDYEEASSQSYVGACGSYTLTRTWTATDFCGNAATSNQVITVLDQTKPEIFQLYTLEGGAKMVAGYAQRVTHDWKYVRFPITFKATPVVLATLSTNTDVTAVVTQVRNVSMQGFELRLREEEAFDGKHGTENVSWVAVDAEYHSGNLKWEAGTLANVNEVPNQLNFQQAYTTAPMFFASPMTNSQSDPASLRNIGLTGTGVQVFAQEELSADAEVVRVSETVGYLALKAGSSLLDKEGNMFGEAGKLDVTNAWATVSYARKYTKPVVIVGGLTNNDTQPVMLRVRNITGSKFEVRLQEWGYEDGAHASESISWMVVEGGVPGNQNFYCSGKASELKPNVNIFAVDNCDDLVSFTYNESSVQEGAGLIQNHSWTAMDDCGNTTLISRFDTCQVAAVKVKGLLYGSLAGNSNQSLMRDNLREKHLLPKDEPYTALPNYPYVEYVAHGANGNGNGNGNGDDDDDDHDPMVVICHLTGTPQQSTMTVHQSELGYYLSIGDVVGACGNSNAGNTTICHKPGTPAQKTLSVPQSALLAHLAHGDMIGDCTGSGNEISTGAANAQYQTIADGNWTATATWLGGQIPPTGNINGKTISIKHNVTIPNAGIVIRNGSKLWVSGGSLKFVNQDFEVRDAEAYFDRAVLDMSTAGSIKMINAAAKLQFSDCSVSVGQSILNQSGGKIKMDHVELKVSENYINTGGTDTLSNVCAVIQGNLTNNLLSKIYISNANIRLPNGSLTNLGTISGGGIKLLIENGSLINSLATWTAPLTQYCVSGTIPLLSGLLPAIEDCNNISNLFSPCNCYDADGATSGSGSGTTGVVSNVTSQINPGKSYGDGTIDDLAALDVTGSEAIVDWMLVEIRNPQNEAEVLGYQSVMLKRDGQLVGENGDSVLVFPGLEEGDYYVSIRHRNHLGIMTQDPIFLSVFDPALVDFTDTNMPVKGGNKGGKGNAGKRTLWGGDFNGDGKIVYQGPYNDIFTLFTRVVGDGNNATNLANFIVPGYELQDYNMDGRVIYQGPLNDRGAMLFGSILSNPGNIAILANYITLDFIP